MPPDPVSATNLRQQFDKLLAGSPSKDDLQILAGTFNFIGSKQPQQVRQTLHDFLHDDPPRESAGNIVPLDELTERLELITKIKDEIRIIENDFELDNYGRATLLLAPLETLRLAQSTTGVTHRLIRHGIRLGLRAIPTLIRLCMFFRPSPRLI